MPNFTDLVDQLSQLIIRLPLTFRSSGDVIDFVKIDNPMLHNNITMVDSKLPEILGYVADYQCAFGESKLEIITQKLNQLNPLKYQRTSDYPFYEHKMKALLMAFALGMNNENVWTGTVDEERSVYVYYQREIQHHLFQSAFVEVEPATVQDGLNIVVMRIHVE